MVYVIKVRKPGQTEPELLEVVAPDFGTAIVLLASEWKGIELIKLEGSYAEGTRGTA